jgi:2-octaprenyl-6-methoxyphenol hydroxylase
MSHTPPAGTTFDVAICGGGMVGATLALALAPLELSIVLIEAAAPGTAEPPSFDERTTALANGSARTYRALDVWRDMEREATPIRRIHVSEQGSFGVARIDAGEQGVDSLGYVISNRAIGAALWPALAAQPWIHVVTPARVTDTSIEGGTRRLEIETIEGPTQLDARLVVAADGARSVLRDRAGIPATHWDYGQTAIVATLTTQRFHDHVAYERFTPDGPLAMLPLADGRCGLVWTHAPDESARLMALPDDAFLTELERAFGLRLGRLLGVGRRQSYELALTRADRHTAPRLAIVGNAAQSLHPIAGQGFNLGLRDAASLAEVLAEELAAGGTDPGAETVLDAYATWRAEDRRRIVGFTDGLVRLFGTPLWVVRNLRGLGLLAFDALPPAKRTLARLSVGAAGRVPRLARGAALPRPQRQRPA